MPQRQGEQSETGAEEETTMSPATARPRVCYLIESGTDKSYVLLPNKDASPLPDTVIQRMEDQVTVTGKEYSKNGVDYLVVDSVK